MRHHNRNKKFGRVRNQRNALMSSLAISLLMNERIKTTEAKAKSLRPYVEKLITLGRKGTLASRRLVISRLGSGGDEAAKKLVDEIAPRYKDRDGGYTRITKMSSRPGDGSSVSMIEFV